MREDKVLNDTARLWSTKGHQNDRFRAAVCYCLSLGFSKREIASHIRETAYVEPPAPRDGTYRLIYSRVEYICTNNWRKSEYDNCKVEKTSKAVDALLTTMDKMNFNNNQNIMSKKKKEVTFALSAYDIDKLDPQKEFQKEAVPLAKDCFKQKVIDMKQRILDISHRQSGALLDYCDIPISSEVSAAGKHRVKLIIENPDQVKEYIHMGLRQDPDMCSLRMIRMIDYYYRD